MKSHVNLPLGSAINKLSRQPAGRQQLANRVRSRTFHLNDSLNTYTYSTSVFSIQLDVSRTLCSNQNKICWPLMVLRHKCREIVINQIFIVFLFLFFFCILSETQQDNEERNPMGAQKPKITATFAGLTWHKVC